MFSPRSWGSSLLGDSEEDSPPLREYAPLEDSNSDVELQPSKNVTNSSGINTPVSLFSIPLSSPERSASSDSEADVPLGLAEERREIASP